MLCKKEKILRSLKNEPTIKSICNKKFQAHEFLTWSNKGLFLMVMSNIFLKKIVINNLIMLIF